MNNIYKRLWNPLWNFITPVMKLKSKTRVGGKIIKHWDKPATPYHRLLDSGVLEVKQYRKLEEVYESINPFELKKKLEKQLKWFFRIVEVRNREAS